MEKLLNIAKVILAVNRDAILSGSLALKLQGKQTRREPEDIDIWISDGHITPIPGMSTLESSDQYSESTYVRHSYIIDGIQIDFFYPAEIKEEPAWRFHEGFKVILPEEILKFKIEHAFDTNYPEGQQKHLEDLAFMINNELEDVKQPIPF